MGPKILGVLHGRDLPLKRLIAWARTADVIYAADGAARPLAHEMLDPIVVGDLDSFPEAAHLDLRVIHSPDQQTTDCDKLLAAIAADGHKSVTLAGMEGDRLDHMLSTIGSVMASPLNVRLALRRGWAWVVSGEGVYEAEPGQRFSVIPLAECRAVTLEGCRWPLENVDLALGGFVSISNEALGPVTVRLGTGRALLVLERDLEAPMKW